MAQTKDPDNSAKGFDVVKKTKKSVPSPNYMKPTSCSDARKEQKHVSKKPSFTSPRISNQSAIKYSTNTCSSTLKDSKFPRFLHLSPGGTESQGASAEKVCPYNSCSLNGHKHESNPPLNDASETSIASLAELFGEVSDAELEEEGRLYLIGDVASEASDTSCVNPSGDEILCLLDEEGVKKDDVGIDEYLPGDSDELSREEMADFHVQFSDSEYEEETELDQFLQDDEKTRELSGVDMKTIEASKISEGSLINEVASNDLRGMEVLGSREDDPASFFRVSEALGEGKTLGVSEETVSIRGRKRVENSEELRRFNPRGPNYLEAEPVSGRERVDLRHQEMDERRKDEEWMTDYALRRTVNQLDTARKRRVALLVAAFETIAPPTQARDARVRPISYGP